MNNSGPKTDPCGTPQRRLSDERSESSATYVLCPTNEIETKPTMSSAVDAEGLLQTLQQDVVINGVEGCRQID